MINENTYERLTSDIRDAAERVTLRLIGLQAAFARKIAKQPDLYSRYRQEFHQGRQKVLNDWGKDIQTFLNNDLPESYVLGVKDADARIKRLGITVSPTGTIPYRQPMAAGIHGTGFIPDSARRLFAMNGITNHLTAFSVFRGAAHRELEGTLQPILRSTDGVIRNLIIETGNATFREGAVTTRVSMLSDLMQRAADQGVTGVVYKGGRRVPIDVYGEMAGRTLTGKSAAQATMNRGAEFGSDLIQISEHQDPSPLCAPYQGRVFSVSGNSNQYPPFQTALDGGLYHPNCRHSVDTYWPGVAEPVERSVDPAVQKLYNEMGERQGELFAYKQTQRQRQIENTIRKYKRREAAGLTDASKAKSRLKIEEWNARLEKHLEDNSFLRRRWDREQIK